MIVFLTLCKFVTFSIPQPDPVHEEIHDSNAIHGCVGPGHVLYWRAAVSGRVSVGRQELCYLQMG